MMTKLKIVTVIWKQALQGSISLVLPEGPEKLEWRSGLISKGRGGQQCNGDGESCAEISA